LRLALIVAVLASSAAVLPARADRLDDDLNTVWESTWDQRGEPIGLTRWERPLRYRITGSDAQRHRATVVAALAAATQAAGLNLSEAATTASGDAAPNLTVEIVDEEGLAENIGCETHIRQSVWSIVDVRIVMRRSQVRECAFHEVMHAMGVPGHPSGKTVLSYFGWRRDVPMMVKRSGLASYGHIEDARTTVAYQLGLVHRDSASVARDDAKSAAWFARAAGQGHFPSQLQYARALIQGAGVPADPVEAHRRLAGASRAGSIAAHRELQQLEKTMDRALLEKARALGPRQPGS
jgi:TPR repeat protein